MATESSASPIRRRLTAILAADAVGFSRQMGQDEERTVQILAAQRAIIDRIVATHNGRIVNTAGDSLLAAFVSSVEAVRCAVEIQEALETRNSGLPETERLEFRIGVNLGDVMVDGADILGDGVNIAARLESIAKPGGICISSSIYDQIEGKLNFGFVDIGEQSLKNIARPVRVYRYDRSGDMATVGRAASRSRKRRLGIGGAAAIALVAAAAWQAGLFEQRAAAPPAATPEADRATPGRPPEAASEETKLKLQIAEAERAKAEAELARSRTDAEAEKQRAAAARAERKDAAPPAPLPPSTQASVAAVPPAVSPLVPQANPPVSAPPLGVSGTGTATSVCDAKGELRSTADSIPVRLTNGEIVIERGDPGQPGYVKVSGRPTPDGRLVLSGSFVSLLKRLRGQELPARFEGVYGNGQYLLSGRMGIQTCTVTVRLENRP